MAHPKVVGSVTPSTPLVEDRPCWLVAEDPDAKTARVVDGFLRGMPQEGWQVVRVGAGCGVLHTIRVESIYLTREAAQTRLAAICADGSLKGIYCAGDYPSSIVRDLSPVEQERYAAWIREHAASCAPDTGEAGRWGFRLKNGGGIGTLVEVVCRSCNTLRNITDYDCW